MPFLNKARSSEARGQIKTVIIAIFYVLAFSLRFFLLRYTNIDTDGYVRWYDFISRHGQFDALGENFAIYTPPYLYLLSLSTLTKAFLPRIVAIKLIPITFDLINSFIVYKIVRLKYPGRNIPLLAASIFLMAPTVLINSAFWGQIDSLYTCFLLIAIYYILVDRPLLAMISYGISAAVKAQAAFLAPFLLLLAFKKRIPWWSFGLIPIVYLVVMLPAILAGRSVFDVFTIYLNQANEFQIPSFNAPNWYIFAPQSSYNLVLGAGLIVCVLILSVWIVAYARKKFVLRSEILLYLSLMSVILVPFLLPKMHDRYFYPADVFSLVTAFYMPNLWFVAVAYQVISSLAYSVFLFDAPRQISLVLATQLNTYFVVYLLWKQSKLTSENKR